MIYFFYNFYKVVKIYYTKVLKKVLLCCILNTFIVNSNMSKEESKFGIDISELDDVLEHAKTLGHIKVCGLMTILAKVDSGMSNRLQFRDINNKFIDISKNSL